MWQSLNRNNVDPEHFDWSNSGVLFSPWLLVTNGFSALSRGSEGTLAKLGHSVHVKAPFTWHCLKNKSYVAESNEFESKPPVRCPACGLIGRMQGCHCQPHYLWENNHGCQNKRWRSQSISLKHCVTSTCITIGILAKHRRQSHPRPSEDQLLPCSIVHLLKKCRKLMGVVTNSLPWSGS